jgi:hypothetical protein
VLRVLGLGHKVSGGRLRTSLASVHAACARFAALYGRYAELCIAQGVGPLAPEEIYALLLRLLPDVTADTPLTGLN